MAKKTFFDGEWESVELLGKGTYGAVYKARKTNSEIEAISAIKEIHIPNDVNDISTLRTEGMTKANIDEELVTELNNLKKEIKALYKFKDSINIVNIEDYKVEEIECDDEFHTKNYIVYIRMELLESINSMFLNESIKDKDVLKLGIDIATALEEMEEENFIHRDIKPENIFVNRHGVYKLGDFGEAKQLNKTISNVSIRGTEQYMAPELLGAKKIDKTVDIYSLGLVLYRFFNNKKFPFYPNGDKVASAKEREEARFRRYSGEDLPKPIHANDEIADIILKMCAFNREDRYQSATELKTDLEEALANIKRAKNIFEEKQEEINEEVEDEKTISLYARKKKNIESEDEVEEISNEIEEEQTSVEETPEDEKTISLYGRNRNKRVNDNKKSSPSLEETEQIAKDFINNISSKEKVKEEKNEYKEKEIVLNEKPLNDYDYVLFASSEDVKNKNTMYVNIRDDVGLNIPLRDDLEDREIFKVRQGNDIKNVMLVIKGNDSVSNLNYLNKFAWQKKIHIPIKDGEKGCTKIVSYNGTSASVKIPSFGDRKRIILVEKGSVTFKLLVEKEDAIYKRRHYIPIIYTVIMALVIISEIKIKNVGEIFGLLMYIGMNYLIASFITGLISSDKKW